MKLLGKVEGEYVRVLYKDDEYHRYGNFFSWNPIMKNQRWLVVKETGFSLISYDSELEKLYQQMIRKIKLERIMI